MAIIKVINGKKHVVASNIIKHNQLEDRTDYGCHPIRAIRDLPEKLTQLKDKDAELQAMIEGLDTEGRPDEQARADIQLIKNDISDITTKATGIKLQENNGELTFTNYEGQSSSFRSGNEVDNNTIQLVNDKIALKKVYTSSEFTGDGTQASPITLANTPDNSTLTIEDNKYVVNGLKTVDGILTAENIKAVDTGLQNQIDTINNSLTNIDSLNSTQDAKLYDLESRTKGMGGYLNTYNFGKTVTQEALTQYAMTDIGVSDPIQIFNGTKVINSYNKHTWVLTNTPDSTPAVFSWEDLGETQQIQYATNKTAGLVKSSTNEFEGEIDTLGHISINGLEEKIGDIETKYVKFTSYPDSDRKAGVVLGANTYGVGVGSGSPFLMLKSSTQYSIDNRKTSDTAPYSAITPKILDYAIKAGLTTNTIELTDDEKTTAQNWLGISSGEIIELVGTDENPINFATSMEVGKTYLISGKLCWLQNMGLKNVSTKALVYKYTSTTLNAFNISSISNTFYNTIGATCYIQIYEDSGYIVSSKCVGGIPIGLINSSTSDRSIFAPTGGGTSGYILKANGSHSAPTWIKPQDAVFNGLKNNTNTFTAEEQAAIKSWLGISSNEPTIALTQIGDNEYSLDITSANIISEALDRINGEVV